MREDYPKLGVRGLCRLFGKTRHAFYDRNWREEKQLIEQAIVLELVSEVRKDMPRLGTDKLYLLIKQPLENHDIKLGRDALHELLYQHGLTIRRKRRRAITTDSNHNYRKYPNLIRNILITAPEQLWVCDITYITIQTGFNYLSLITDGYSRKIIGYCLSQRLDNKGCIIALQMAIAGRRSNVIQLIHHSDRGIQYCSQQYIDILLQANILVSMTEKGDPYENAMAERVNGILKTEFGLGETFSNHELAKQAVERGVSIYNEKRPHASCDYLTPIKAHEQSGILHKRWKQKPVKSKEGGYEHINSH
jgi:transposase InsO family protein